MNALNDGSRQQDGMKQEQNNGARLTRKPEEVGQLLGIGRNGVYELVRKKKLRSLSVGRKILIPLSAIDEFLAGETD